MGAIDAFEALNRERGLTSDETDALQRAIHAERVATGTVRPIYRRWTLKDNQELLKAARKRGGLKLYAEQEGRTYSACQSQLRDLKAQRRRRGIAFIGRFFYDGEVGGE
jgi:hypothetical protein